MQILRIQDGTKVICTCTLEGHAGCGKKHTVKGMRGNNLGWEDEAGWIGSYDAAHGPFPIHEAATSCPDCKKE